MTKPRLGRQTAADRAVIPFAPDAHRLRPPDDLGANEAALFRHLVASLPPSHFVEADQPLLVLYVEAVCMARRCAAGLTENPALAPIWERSARLATQMSSKLRLCPSSRSDAKSVARAAADYKPSYYDLMRDGQA